MDIGIFGRNNPVTRFIEELLKNNGINVTVLTDNSIENVIRQIGGLDYLILNHSIPVNRKVIESVPVRSRIIEISPVKTPYKQFSGEITSISLLRESDENTVQDYMTVIYVDDISVKGNEEFVRDIFRGFRFLKMGIEEHERLASEILVKPYVMALLSRKISDLEFNPSTIEYEKILSISRIISNHNIDEIREIIRYNPYSSEIFEKMENDLKRVWNELSFY